MRVVSASLALLALVGVAHAGDMRSDPPTFATELVQPNGPNDLIMPATDLAYVLGIAPDARPMTLRFDFEPARLNSPVAAGRLSLEINSPFGQDAQAFIEVVEGGRPGDAYVIFSVRFQGIVSAGDALVLDLEGVAMRVDGAALLAEQPIQIRGTLGDGGGVLDGNGRRTTTLLDARQCILVDFRPGGRGLAATPRETFVGLPRTIDDTAWLRLGFEDCRRSDGAIVDGIDDLGALELLITGPLTAVDRADLPGLGVFEVGGGAALDLRLDVGPIRYDGPVNIRVDGRTPIAEQVLELTISFVGRVPGTNRRLLGPRALTRWEPVDRRQIVQIDPVPPGADCAAGGVRIEEGVDQNYNGILDEGEVTESQLLCNGARGQPGEPGFSVVQAVEPAPPSDDCESGGWRISSGKDLNRDGRLQAEEVEVEAVICDGEDGEDGEAGPAGPPGRAGVQGPQGPLGERGPAGAQGEEGPAGEGGCAAAPGQSPDGAWWLLLPALIGLRRRYS